MTRSLPQSLLVLFLLVGLVAAQQLLSLPGYNALWRSLQDALHAPWFFVVVVVLYWWFKDANFWRRLLFVGGIGILLAIGTEFAQSFVAERSASVGDLIRNAVGGGLGFLFATAVHSVWPVTLRFGVAGLALAALVAFTLWQPWQQYQLRVYRASLLPQVVDVADERIASYTSVNEGGLLRFETAGSDWPDYEGMPVVRVTFGISEYPTLYFSEVMQAWAPYAELVLDTFVLGNEPLPLTVAVQYEGSSGTSAYTERTLAPGATQWVIPRSQFVPDEAVALRIRDVLVYTTADYAGRSVLIGSLYLR